MAQYICPHCRNPIDDDEALLCLYCGEGLDRKIGFLGKIRYPGPKFLVGIFVLLVILSFLLLMVR
jgi:hypothetical protein